MIKRITDTHESHKIPKATSKPSALIPPNAQTGMHTDSQTETDTEATEVRYLCLWSSQITVANEAGHRRRQGNQHYTFYIDLPDVWWWW